MAEIMSGDPSEVTCTKAKELERELTDPFLRSCAVSLCADNNTCLFWNTLQLRKIDTSLKSIKSDVHVEPGNNATKLLSTCRVPNTLEVKVLYIIYLL